MRRRCRTVMVEIDLDDLDDDDLAAELEERGYVVTKTNEVGGAWHTLADAMTLGRDPQPLLRDLIYQTTGRIV